MTTSKFFFIKFDSFFFKFYIEFLSKINPNVIYLNVVWEFTHNIEFFSFVSDMQLLILIQFLNSILC